MRRMLRLVAYLLLVAAATLAPAGAVWDAQRAEAEGVGSDLSPARDLRGTWFSSLQGKGYQVAGELSVAGSGTAQIVENGNIRLVIKSVVAQKVGTTTMYRAHGTITLSLKELVETVTVTTAKGPKRFPPQKIPVNAAGASSPVVLNVSSSRVNLPPVKIAGATISLAGSFTTDLMSGTMTQTIGGSSGIPGIAGTLLRPLRGSFHLMRVR